MTERTMILSKHGEAMSVLPKNWAGELFGLLGRKFDALISFVTKWTGF